MNIIFAEEIKENPKKDQIYHVIVKYQKRFPLSRFTGHMVLAKSPAIALDIANRHNIGYPMGESKDVICRSVWQKKPYPAKIAEERRGDIWYEDKEGNLQGLKKNRQKE